MTPWREWLSAPRFQQARLTTAVGILAFVVGFAVSTLASFGGAGSDAPGFAVESLRLRADNRRLARDLTRLQTDTQVDRQAYGEVERQLTELQEKILDQQQELSFYRGIVGGSADTGLQVKDFVLQAMADGRYEIGFVVAQIAKTEREVAGQVQIRIEGERDGRVVSVDVAPLMAAAERSALGFRLRYFQDFRAGFTLPDNFAPGRIVLRVQPVGRGSRASVASFPWAVTAT